MPEEYDDPAELPEDHPLADYDGELETHADHLDALGEFLQESDPEDVHGAMLVVTTVDGTDTVPTLAPDADAEGAIWYQLAAHLSHVAASFDAPPQDVARHACHVLQDAVEFERGDGP